MSFRMPAFDSLPAGRRLLELARSDSNRDLCGAQSAASKQSDRSRETPEAWQAQIAEAEAKRDRRGGKGFHLSRKPADLAAAIEEPQRYCSECKAALPGEMRPDAKTCSEKCKRERRNRRIRERNVAG